jgi:hypothetical protein
MVEKLTPIQSYTETAAGGNSLRAADLAGALGLRPVSRGVWRGACPLCGGSRRFQLREGDRAPLVWCFGGCDRQAILAELRRRGLLPDHERPQDREAWQREREQRRQAEDFRRAGELLLEAALAELPAHDPRRGDLTELQRRLKFDPGGELDWWRAHKPELARALIEAWRKHERRLRGRTARWVDRLAGEVERGE